MGHVNVKVTLKNHDDMKKARKGQMPEYEIRQITVDAMVDTGASSLVINKDMFQQLGLEAIDERVVTFANDARETCILTEPLEIHWEDRFTAMPALVVNDASDVLLGVLPLEGMDLMVDPVHQKLTGVHGDEPMYLAKQVQTP